MLMLNPVNTQFCDQQNQTTQQGEQETHLCAH